MNTIVLLLLYVNKILKINFFVDKTAHLRHYWCMIFCEYCGSDTELLGSKRIEFAEGVVIREEKRKCNKCGHKFYVMLDNKDMENTSGE